MIDWLRKRPAEPLLVEVSGRPLPLVLRRTARARRMTMRLDPAGNAVRITLPQWGRTADALAFARTQAGWLAAQLDALPRPATVQPGSTLRYLGDALPIRHDPARPRRVQLADGAIIAGGPAEQLGPRLARWLQAEARRILADDLAWYCQRAGRPVPRMLLSGAQRRWGSCARDGTIRLNWRLVMAPPSVRRSVVAHEVAHLVQFDHSPAFHALLAELFEGDIAAANRWLRRQGRTLYASFG